RPTTTSTNTSTDEASRRLQPRRRWIALTAGRSTATLKSATKIVSRTFAIEASAHATATARATSRIVLIERETSTSVCAVSVVPVLDPSDAIRPSYRARRMAPAGDPGSAVAAAVPTIAL